MLPHLKINSADIVHHSIWQPNARINAAGDIEVRCVLQVCPSDLQDHPEYEIYRRRKNETFAENLCSHLQLWSIEYLLLLTVQARFPKSDVSPASGDQPFLQAYQGVYL